VDNRAPARRGVTNLVRQVGKVSRQNRGCEFNQPGFSLTLSWVKSNTRREAQVLGRVVPPRVLPLRFRILTNKSMNCLCAVTIVYATAQNIVAWTGRRQLSDIEHYKDGRL
jgi:hypothetical protein